MSRWRIVLLGLGLFVATAAVWALWPAPIDPAPYAPPPSPPMVGALAPNELLGRAVRLGDGLLPGGEDVAVDAQGRVHTGTVDGRILRLEVGDAGVVGLEVLTETGGRPLGLDFAPDGSLVVADADRGLLRVSPQGGIEVLAREAAGVPFRFTNDVDVASDGRIFFTDASDRYGIREYLFDLLEARPHGRLLVYDPTTRATEVLAEGLYFANGVALSADESFVVVNETYRYRIQRCRIAGPAANRCEIFVDNLPGFPDGVAADGSGTFWVAMYTVRNPRMDRLHPHPTIKRLLSKLPRVLWPKPEPYGLVLALDEDGRWVRSLHDPGGETVREITSVEPYRGGLYLGTLRESWIAYWRPDR